jgi:ketopantoate hydroxymethyltransferase
MKKISILDMMKMKNQNIPISRITAYDFPASYAAEKA